MFAKKMFSMDYSRWLFTEEKSNDDKEISSESSQEEISEIISERVLSKLKEQLA